MKIKNFVIYMILIFAFMLTPNVAFAKCSTVEGNSTSGCQNFNSAYSDCMSLSSAFSTGIDQVISNRGLNYSVGDYSHKLITREYIYDTSYFFKNRYYIYLSKQPLVLNDGKFECSEEFLVFNVSEFALHEQYPLSKKCCNGKAYTCFTGSVSSYSFSGDIISSNYDVCDTNGNVVQGALLSEGYIEITLPEHTGDSCVISGNNEVVLSCSYSYTNFFNSPPYIEIFGVDNYEYIDSSFEISADMGNISGMGTWLFTLPYNTKTKVGVCFYDDLNNYYEDYIYITCYENSEDVPPDTDIDFEVGGGGGESGSASGGLSGISNFFSELSGIFSDIGEFFIGFSRFISNSFSFLPTEINVVLGVGILLVILLRIFGR